MNSFLKKISPYSFLGLALFFVCAAGVSVGISYPHAACAQTVTGEQPFGGEAILVFDSEVCDCGGNYHLILDYKTDSALALYYQAGQSTLYSNYDLEYTYQMGTYSYGAESCSIEVYDDCYDLYNDGTYGSMPGTGTSLTEADAVMHSKILAARSNVLFQSNPSNSSDKNSYFAFFSKIFPKTL